MALAGAPTALVLRALGLGDLLTSVPALRGLRAALPGHRVVLATPPALEPLVRLTGAVDDVLPAAGLEPLRWRGEAPDVAVNLHGRGPQSHRLLAALQPRSLVAYGCRQVGHDGLPWREQEHEVLRWCRLVETCLDVTIDPDALDLAVPVTPSVRPGAVVVHPGAAFAGRRWPASRFASVCRFLAAAGHDVVVTGSEAERPLAAGIVDASGLPGTATLAGSLTLEQLAALVADASLVVCGDTGVSHLASAYRRPSVTLMGPVSPELWGPPIRPQHVVLWHGDGNGNPWGSTLDPALAQITVEEVLAATNRLLSLVS